MSAWFNGRTSPCQGEDASSILAADSIGRKRGSTPYRLILRRKCNGARLPVCVVGPLAGHRPSKADKRVRFSHDAPHASLVIVVARRFPRPKARIRFPQLAPRGCSSERVATRRERRIENPEHRWVLSPIQPQHSCPEGVTDCTRRYGRLGPSSILGRGTICSRIGFVS